MDGGGGNGESDESYLVTTCLIIKSCVTGLNFEQSSLLSKMTVIHNVPLVCNGILSIPCYIFQKKYLD